MHKEGNKLEFKDKKILVVGLGVSGFHAAQWLAGRNAHVVVTDNRPQSELNPDFCKKLKEKGVILETGIHKESSFLSSELIIVSPGVPNTMPEIESAVSKGIPVMGELELASILTDTPIIAVTGTNGKSTVTVMLGNLLKKAGFEFFVGGNIGTPLMAYVSSGQKAEYAVVEVSSFQLDTIERFSPFISVILNISPDHLDRYANYDSYVNSKLKIFKNQGKGQYLILNDDDDALAGINQKSGVSVLRYGFDERENINSFLNNKSIKTKINNGAIRNISVEQSKLVGKHNFSNIMAVILCGLILGIGQSIIAESINDFNGLPNRLEWIKELEGVDFFNDSKATNVDAAIKAVKSFDRQLILIAGGLHKGSDYDPLVKACIGKVKHCIFIGKAKNLMAKAFEDYVDYDFAKDMNEAVSIAFSRSNSGDVVLLSPACSSFDMYEDYADRGTAFRTAVERLGNA
jgi:UDP-N-acetylmuramoylalanine--D-glutamate ligase